MKSGKIDIGKKICSKSMHKKMIQSEPLTKFTVCCPYCQKPFIRYTGLTWKYLLDDPWLLDGDTIPGVWERLTLDQQSLGSDYGLSVGKCGCADEAWYYVLEVSLIGSTLSDVENPMQWLANNVEGAIDRPGVRYLTASYVGDDMLIGSRLPECWVVKEVTTSHGLAHYHCIGPMELYDTSLIGRHGVSCCRSGGQHTWEMAAHILLSLWDEMQLLQRQCVNSSLGVKL